jgi:hypothetical protein
MDLTLLLKPFVTYHRLSVSVVHGPGAYTQENLENVPFIYRLKLYELFRNGKNETALYRLICYIEVSFKAGVTICKMTR